MIKSLKKLVSLFGKKPDDECEHRKTRAFEQWVGKVVGFPRRQQMQRVSRSRRHHLDDPLMLVEPLERAYAEELVEQAPDLYLAVIANTPDDTFIDAYGRRAFVNICKEIAYE